MQKLRGLQKKRQEKKPELKQNERRCLKEQSRREKKNCHRKRENWHLNEMVFNLSILWQILIRMIGIQIMRSI